MNIMVIGGGGREHAIIKKLKENSNITTVYALPGNGGIAADAGGEVKDSVLSVLHGVLPIPHGILRVAAPAVF